MRDSTKWTLTGWGMFVLTNVCIALGETDVRVSALMIVMAMCFCMQALLKALGK